MSRSLFSFQVSDQDRNLVALMRSAGESSSAALCVETRSNGRTSAENTCRILLTLLKGRE